LSKRLANSTVTRFLAAGSLNFFATNICLQALLLIPTLPTLASTTISQIVNAVLGYFLYRNTVFLNSLKGNQMTGKITLELFRFGLLSCALLAANTIGINLATIVGYSRNIGAVLMIPPLTLFSYFGQKYWVFRKPRAAQSVSSIHK
jgi:putative flippase GtrA